MTYFSDTFRAVRKAVLQTTRLADFYYNGTATSTAVGSVVLGDVAGVYPNSHWQYAEIRVVESSTGTITTKRISSYAGTTGTITPITVWSNAPTTSNIEVLAPPLTFDIVDMAIKEAIRELAPVFLINAENDSSAYSHGIQNYALPSGWRTLEKVEFNLQRVNGGYFSNNGGQTVAQRSVGATTATTYAAQRLYFPNGVNLKKVWLKLSKLGSPTGNVSLYLYQNSTDDPTASFIPGVSAAIAVACSTLKTYPYPVEFELSAPVYIAPQTYIWLVLGTTNVDSANYVRWQYDSAANLYGGIIQYGETVGSLTDGTGVHCFNVESEQGAWVMALPLDDYDVKRPSAELIIHPINSHIPDLTPMRWVGRSIPSIPTADTDTLELNADPVIRLARANLLMAIANGNKAILQDALTIRKTVKDELSLEYPWSDGLVILE